MVMGRPQNWKSGLWMLAGQGSQGEGPFMEEEFSAILLLQKAQGEKDSYPLILENSIQAEILELKQHGLSLSLSLCFHGSQVLLFWELAQ